MTLLKVCRNVIVAVLLPNFLTETAISPGISNWFLLSVSLDSNPISSLLALLVASRGKHRIAPHRLFLWQLVFVSKPCGDFSDSLKIFVNVPAKSYTIYSAVTSIFEFVRFVS